MWLDDEGKMDIRNVVRGDTVDQLLRYVNIDPSVIRENYQRIVSHPALDDATRKALLDELELGLQGYAYGRRISPRLVHPHRETTWRGDKKRRLRAPFLLRTIRRSGRRRGDSCAEGG